MNIGVVSVVKSLRRFRNGMKGLRRLHVLTVEREILKSFCPASPLPKGPHPSLPVTLLELPDSLEPNESRWCTGSQRPIFLSLPPSS